MHEPTMILELALAVRSVGNRAIMLAYLLFSIILLPFVAGPTPVLAVNTEAPFTIEGRYSGIILQNGSSLLVVVFQGGYLMWTSNGTVKKSWVVLSGKEPLGFARRLVDGGGFNVATVQSGTFVASTSAEVNTLLDRLLRLTGSNQVFLIGVSAGGTVVGSYITSRPNDDRIIGAVIIDAVLALNLGEEVDWSLNGLPNSALRAENLTIPTLLIWGENDTVTPRVRHMSTWLSRAPLGLTSSEIYEYGHDPWDNSTNPNVRTQVEDRITEYIPQPIPAIYGQMTLLMIAAEVALVVAGVIGFIWLCTGRFIRWLDEQSLF